MTGADSIWDSVNASITARDFGGNANLDYVQLEQASRLHIVPIRWLWPGWLARGKFHVLAGAPGTGKTTIAMSVAAIISSGGAFRAARRLQRAVCWCGREKTTLLIRWLRA